MVAVPDSNAKEKQKCIDTILQAISEMKLEKGSLSPRPTPQQVLNAKRAISEYEHELIEQLDEIVSDKCPYGLSRELFLKITELKVDRCKKDTEIRKFNFTQVLELEERHRHYQEIITLLENGLVKIEDGTFESEKNATRGISSTSQENGEEDSSSLEKAVALKTSAPSDSQSLSNTRDDGKLKDGIIASKPLSKDDINIGTSLKNGALSQDAVKETRVYDPHPVPDRVIEEDKNSYDAQTAAPSSYSASYLKNVSIDVKLKTIRESLEEKDMSEFPGLVITPQTAAAFFTPPKASDVARTLTMLEEESKGNKFNPKLMAYIEQTVAERREVFDISTGYENSISHLPDSISYLDCVRDMNLSGNRLLSLPDTLVNLTNLVKLDLSCNQLVKLPESIGNLTNLEFLNLNHNYFEEIPLSIGNCKQLQFFDASFNSLKGLSESFCRLENLKECYLQFNQIKRLPRSFGNLASLQVLDTHFNQLEGLPESITQIHGLTRLNASGNHFAFQQLPNSLGNLTNLTVLDLSENYISVLPVSFANLRNLKKLYLQNNPLKIPPIAIAQGGIEAVMNYMSNLKTESETRSKKSKGSLRDFFSGSKGGDKRYSHSV